MLNIAAVLTSHNRRELTVRVLSSLFHNVPTGVSVSAVLVDDGSTDGTATVVRREFSGKVKVLDGNGALFWAKGMAMASALAERSEPDYILWLNDDVDLFPDAIARAVLHIRNCPSAILVGSMREVGSDRITYAGYRRVGHRPGSFATVLPSSGDVVEIDTMNGNFVLIPRLVYKSIGQIDGRFEHAYGDIDYGLRAGDAGFPVYLMPGVFGVCSFNSIQGTWRDPSVGRCQRLRGLFSPKGMPIRSQLLFVRRHSPVLWPIYLLLTYGRAALSITLGMKI